MAVEGLHHLVVARPVACLVGSAPGHPCCLRHELQVVDVVCRGDERHRRVLAEARLSRAVVVPVAEAVAHDAVLRPGGEVVHVAPHRFVVVHHQGAVAIHVVVHEGQDDEGGAPFRGVVEEVAEGDILRRRGGHHPVLLLCVHDVAYDFGYERRHVVVVEQRGAAEVVLLQPSQLLAMGAVGEHALHVGAFGALYEAVGLRHPLVVAPEGGGLTCGVMDEAASQAVQHGQAVGVRLACFHGSLHLDVAEAVIGEGGVPCLAPVAAERVFVVVGAARLRLVARPLGREAFGDDECHLLPRAAGDGDFREAGEVLPHVADEGSGGDAPLGLCRGGLYGVGFDVVGAFHRMALHHLHRGGRLRAQLAFRTLHGDRRHPFAVVVVRVFAPHGEEARIVGLASEDAVEGDGAEGPPPTLVGEDVLCRPVGVGDVEAQEQLGRAEAALQFAVACASLHVEEAVAQEHGDGVGTQLQAVRHVESVVIHRLAVFAPQWRKLAVAHQISIDGEFVVPQAADIQHGVGHIAVGEERLSEEDASRRERIDIRPFGLETVFLEHLVAPAAFGQVCIRLGDGTYPLGGGGEVSGEGGGGGRGEQVGRHHADGLPGTPWRPFLPGVLAGCFGAYPHVPVVAYLVGGQMGQLDELAFRGLHRPAVIDQFAGDMLHHLYLIGGLRDGGVAVGDVLPAHAGHAFFHDGGALPLVVACRLRHIQLGVCHGGGDEQQAC